MILTSPSALVNNVAASENARMKTYDIEPRENEPLGAYIRRIRIHRGWSQGTFAERIGTTREYVSQFETGHVKWPGTFVASIADALGIRMSWMGRAAGRVVPDVGAVWTNETLRTAERELPEEVFSLWARMGAEDREIALTWLRRLARPAPVPTANQEEPEPTVANSSA